tara:strand:+ start:253 stop:786 length:534 start_codon:yes stop_codon:yes gene_type:complete
MINSIGSQNYAVQQTRDNTNKVEQIALNPPNKSYNTDNLDFRQNTISFIESATPEELESRVNSLIGRKPSLIGIDMRGIINTDNANNGNELLERAKRLSSQVEPEINNVLKKEQDLISQGRAEGKSAKDILMSIVNMQDEQSDAYKLAMHWGNEGLGSPKTYAKLVELTPSYVNYYA